MLWALLTALPAISARAEALTYVPVGLAWTADEVERAGAGSLGDVFERAARSGQLGCRRQCERIQRIFDRLLVQARGQSPRSATLPWTLIVVQLPDVDAMALPGGQVVLSEPFAEQRAPGDEALAFVLAHEMAHSVLEHERQALTYARLLLPRQVPRSVQDMYVEIEYNFALRKALEPVLQQGEYEADELGLLMASAAGFAPQRQLDFLSLEASDAGTGPEPVLLATHPRAQARLAALRQRLPLAERLFERSRR